MLQNIMSQLLIKKSFFTMIGFDELTNEIRGGTELERLWLCDLGTNDNLWKVSKLRVPSNKTSQWLNRNESFDQNYWEKYMEKKLKRFGRSGVHKVYQRAMKMETKQIAEDKRVFCYGFILKKLFEP